MADNPVLDDLLAGVHQAFGAALGAQIGRYTDMLARDTAAMTALAALLHEDSDAAREALRDLDYEQRRQITNAAAALSREAS